MFVWISRLQFQKTPLEKLRDKVKKHSLSVWTCSKNVFQRKIFYFKMFHWRRGQHVCKHCRIFLAEGREFSVQCQEMMKTTVLSKEWLSSWCSFGYAECNFHRPAQNNQDMTGSFLLHNPIWWKAEIVFTFLRKNSFLLNYSCGHVHWSFDNSAKRFWKRLKLFQSWSEIVEKKLIDAKSFFLKMFAWTRRMPFWLSDQKSFRCKARKLCSMFQSDKKLLFFWKRNCLPQKVLWTPGKHFWQHWRKMFDIKSKIFCSLTEEIERNFLFQKKQTFPQTVPLDTCNAHLTDPAKNPMPCAKQGSK